MRDPDLVLRAQVAASALEGAWRRWRTVHGHTAFPTPAVSSYVGYSLQEPWGQPRVVFGIAVEDAEQLAALIERPDGVKPDYAAAPTQLGARGRPVLPGILPLPLPQPRQAPAMAASMRHGQPLGDLLLANEDSGYDEPVYRQAAAAMKEAVAARENATRTKPDTAEAVDAPLLSPERIGALTRAASTARAEAEARIRAAALTEQADPDQAQPDTADAGAAEPGGGEVGVGVPAGVPGDGGPGDGVVTVDAYDADDIDAGLGDVQDEDGQPEADAEQAAAGDQTVGGDDSAVALPRIYATDVLEPLPAPEAAAGTQASDAGAPAGELDQDEAVLERDISDQEAVPDQDDHETAASAPSGGPGAGNAGKARTAARNHPIARRPRTKRSGSPSQASGS